MNKAYLEDLAPGQVFTSEARAVVDARSIQTLPLSEGVIGSGVDELRWPRPVKPGDTLRVQCEVIDVTPSKLHPSRGTVRMRMTTLNQNDQPVQTMIANLLAFRRPEQAA